MGDRDNQRYVSFNKPRLLGEKETAQEINHWKATIEVFYSRESNFEDFFEDNVTWNPQAENFGFEAEVDGLQRTAAKKAKQLKHLLVMITSHIPWPHVTQKVLTESRNFTQVWDIILRAYGAKPTHDAFLDLLQLNKTATESNLTFYERLVGHLRTHLAPAGATGGGVTAPQGGDQMSVSLLDMVAAIWLDKLDKKLADIVKTEFHVRLKNGTRISELVETIAPQVNQLLARFEATSGESIRSLQGATAATYDEADIDGLVDAMVQRMNFRNNGSNNNSGNKSFCRLVGGTTNVEAGEVPHPSSTPGQDPLSVPSVSSSDRVSRSTFHVITAPRSVPTDPKLSD